jgi:UDP-glucose 4-epimerase
VVGVTGGGGFVGTNLVHALRAKNHDVVVIDDFSTGLRSNLKNIDCEVHEVSLIDFTGLSKALEKCEYIFHLGARGSVPRSIKNPRATFDVNVTGTLNVLESARGTGASIAFSSSSSVYGANLDLPKNEKMWTAPLTPYAASKLSGEGLVHSYANSFNLSAVTYRFFNIFGPWQRPDHDYAAVIPKWIWKLMHGEPIEVFGDGHQSRDFTFVDTVISILIEGMERKLHHPNPLNLAYGSKISLIEVLEIMKGRYPNLSVNYVETRLGDVQKSQNSPELLKSLFPNIEPVDFHVGLERTFDWFNVYGTTIANGPKVND